MKKFLILVQKEMNAKICYDFPEKRIISTKHFLSDLLIRYFEYAQHSFM